MDNATPVDYISTNGYHSNKAHKGINIIKMSDGSVRKVIAQSGSLALINTKRICKQPVHQHLQILCFCVKFTSIEVPSPNLSGIPLLRGQSLGNQQIANEVLPRSRCRERLYQGNT